VLICTSHVGGVVARAVRAAARDLLAQRTVLMHSDLELAAARAFAAVFADADEATRRELEQVALDLPSGVTEAGERGERLRQAAGYRRDQLLGFVDPERLVTTAARERRAELDAEESGPPPGGTRPDLLLASAGASGRARHGRGRAL
jgi:hypothetical protein